MSVFKIKFAEVHTPLFIAGTNLGQKLDVSKRPLRMWYDRVNKDLTVEFNNSVSIIPYSNVVAVTPFDEHFQECMPEGETFQTAKKAAPEVLSLPKGKIKAQVSTPTSHVFAGEGEGLK